MGIVDLFRKKNQKRPQRTETQRFIRSAAILRHKKIVDNLKNEFETLAWQLKDVETDEALTKMEREKASNRMVGRMTLLQHEISIREELLQWL